MTATIEENSIRNILLNHFDVHQRCNQENECKSKSSKFNANTDNVARRVYLIRRDISTYFSKNKASKNDENDAVLSKQDTNRKSVEQDLSNVTTKMSNLAVIDDIQEEVSSSIHFIIEATFIEIATKSLSNSKEDWEESVNRVLELAAVLSTGMKNGYIMNTLLSKIEYCSNASIDNVRVKACYFLGLCLKSLQFSDKNEKSSTDKENDTSCGLWKSNCIKKICTILQPRITDKTLNVRIAAIQASKYIFQPSASTANSKFIIKQFIKIQDYSRKLLRDLVQRLNHDPTITCRIEALNSVPICKKVVNFIIERIRDVKEKVRTTALDILKRIDVHLLSIEQRCTIIRSGLTTRCDVTLDATVKLICCAWMKSVKFDPMLLLQLLDVANNDKIGELAIRQVISVLVVDDNTKSEGILKELSEAEISALKDNVLCSMDVALKGFIDPAHILFMHGRCAEVYESKAFNSTKKQELIGELMYDVPTLTEALEEHLKCYINAVENPLDEDGDNERVSLEDSHWFVCLQLLRLVEYADLQEAGSRRCFTASLHNILCNLDTPDGLVEELVKAFKYAYTLSESDFMDGIAQMIQYISEEAKNAASPDKDVFNFDDKDDIFTMNKNNNSFSLGSHLRIVNILSNMLEHLSSKTSNTSVWEKLYNEIVTATTSPNHELREIGVTCLGRFALLSDGAAVNSEIMPCLQAVANNDDEIIEVRAKASMAICDLLLLFDSQLSNSLEEFSSLLFSLFDHEQTGFVCVASEICVKLLLSGTLKDEAIVARLLVIYFSDAIDDEKDDEDIDDITEIGSMVRLQQLLSMFFPAYSMKSVENREIITKSIKVVLFLSHENLRKQKNAVKANVTLINKVIDYTFTLVGMGEEHMANYEAKNEGEDKVKEEQVRTSSLSTMIIILDFLIENSNLPSTYIRSLCKIVSGVCFSGKEDVSQVRKFHKQIDEFEDMISDKTALNTIQKLYDILPPLDAEEDTSDVADQTMLSKLQNISLIGPNDESTAEIQNISLNVTNIASNSSQIQHNDIHDTSISDNIMTEELHDSSLEI